MFLCTIRQLLINRDTPIVVALDGRSGSGKSTIAALVTEEFGAALIQGDDFFAAEISDAAWELRTPEAKAIDAMNWRRLRAEALEPLLAGKSAKWHAFDFEAGAQPDGTYRMRSDWVERKPSALIVLDGAYSTRPELADLIDFSVLIEAPVGVRHHRLAARENAHFLASWHARWDAAEEYYFTCVRPRSSFDCIVANALGPTKGKFRYSSRRRQGYPHGKEARHHEKPVRCNGGE